MVTSSKGGLLFQWVSKMKPIFLHQFYSQQTNKILLLMNKHLFIGCKDVNHTKCQAMFCHINFDTKSFTIIIVILFIFKMFIFNLCVYQINVIMAINMSVRYSFMVHLS